MKAKLIKTGNDYLLRDMSDEVLSITNGTIEGRKLSKQNCNSIFGVVDVEKLAKQKYPNVDNEDYEYDSEQQMLSDEYKKRGFIQGAKEILELNKDKVFTEEDVRNAYSYGVSICHSIGHSAINYTDKYIQSLQQPTEMEVEIEMQCLDPNCDGVNKKGVCIPGNKPKLGENGCLILKKVMS